MSYSYFHPFVASDAKAHWEGYTSPRMDYFCGDIPNVNFNAGFLVAIKPGYMDIPHIHDGADNFFIVTGAELDDVFNSEFEVDMFLGDSPSSMEMYKITKPSIIRVPAGTWHCPVYYKKIHRGINTIMWYEGISTGRVYPKVDENGNETVFYEKDNWVRPCVKDETKLCTYCGLCFSQSEDHVKEFMAPFFEKRATTQKYKDCIIELKQDHHKLGDAVLSPRIAFNGVTENTQVPRQFSFNIITKGCTLGDDEPVGNGQVEEFLWFSGADAFDPWTSFDAEIEMLVGPDPDHLQKIVINKPGVVALPGGSWKGPMKVIRAGKPLCFIPWYSQMKPRYKLTRKTVGGKPFMVYDDETTIKEPTAGDELFMQIKR